MSSTATSVTIGEAVGMVNASRSKILRAIKSGKLSARREADDERNTYLIETAELFRVFDASENKPVIEKPTSNNDQPEPLGNEIHEYLLAENKDLKNENENLKLEVKDTKTRLEELRDQFKALPNPEDVEDRIRKTKDSERERAENLIKEEKDSANKLLASTKQEQALKNEEWEENLKQKQADIEKARNAQAETDARLADERKAREILTQEKDALERRGLFARILNKKPKMEAIS